MPQIEFRAMGCQMLAIVEADEARAANVLAHVPRWFAEWENVLSRFRADSELNRLNASAGRPVRVSETLWQVLEKSLEAANASNGLVTPAVLDALETAGYDKSFERIGRDSSRPERHSLLAPNPRATNFIELDATTRTVRLPPGMRLDLGGIAKGWSADQAAQRLSQVGPALVDAGGDLAISGALANGARWQIAIADPFEATRDLERLVLRAGGVATSGRDYRRWEQDGKPQHHIIDPRTNRPAITDVLSVTVIAPTTSQAEVAAKVALILGSRAGLAWIEARSELAALLVLEDGTMMPSTRFDQYVWRETFIAEPDAIRSLTFG